jgi:FtsP/CotA-like multicopper oxidase with cupredoxin domain
MPIPYSAITRRSVLIGAGGITAAALFPYPRRLSAATREITLTAVPARVRIVDSPHPETDVWCYDGRVPGPEIRVRQGERVRIVVVNKLNQETTVHWHGVRVPIGMDGVPGISQRPIQPGESFAYEFTPPDAGTFWYHPHANSLEQLGRGMAGALIVEEPQSVPVDRDVLWMLADWRLTSGAQIASGFGNRMEAAMSGRVGNSVTLNGVISNEEQVRAGERIRLRLVNCALARIMALRFESHRPVIIAIDGQPCEPHEPENGRLLLGPAMRIDVVLDMKGEPGRRYRVIDDFYQGLDYWLTELVYASSPPIRGHAVDPPLVLARNPLTEPDLAKAERRQLTLEGGMMGGMGMMGGLSQGAWAINGTSMTGDGHAGMHPLITLQRGRSYVVAIRNDTAWWHPMHLHGHSFRVLSRNGSPVPHRQWADTVLVPPRQTVDIAFVADSLGDWMLHCHVSDHQMSGMMTILRIA